MKHFELETDRLLLRHFRQGDGDAVAALLTDAEVCRYEPFEVMSREDAFAEAERYAASKGVYAVILKETGQLIGKLTLTDQQFFGAYELGYTLRRDCWGNGYTVEAARAVMEYGFMTKGVRRITAETDVQNVRSRRVLEKLGMRQEGIFVKSAAYQTSKTGEPVWSDYCAYAILREEFLK